MGWGSAERPDVSGLWLVAGWREVSGGADGAAARFFRDFALVPR